MNNFKIPDVSDESPGIHFGDRLVRSVLLTADVSYIHHLETDAVLGISPFDPSSSVNLALTSFCKKPVFCDIGGSYRHRKKAVELANEAEDAGAAGIVISRPVAPEVVGYIRERTSGNLIYTVMYLEDDIAGVIDAGVDMLNISTGKTTAETIEEIRQHFSEIPIMASGGPFESTIRETIRMGADAIVYNPPTAAEMLRSIFDDFRDSRRLER